jgi:hypothetical protein
MLVRCTNGRWMDKVRTRVPPPGVEPGTARVRTVCSQLPLMKLNRRCSIGFHLEKAEPG